MVEGFIEPVEAVVQPTQFKMKFAPRLDRLVGVGEQVFK